MGCFVSHAMIDSLLADILNATETILIDPQTEMNTTSSTDPRQE